MSRTLHLNAFLKPAGEYLAGWRHPDSPAAAGVDFRHVAGLVRRVEEAKFDSVFLPDLVGVPDSKPEVLDKVAVVNDGFEPLTLLSALSAVTSRIGLIATTSTSYSEPYTVARAFASLDHLSKGRAGWNVVTSINNSEARNFGLDVHLGHAERYERAEEFYDVVEALWDSFDDDAFLLDRQSGRYFDADRIHWLNHRGKHFTVAGPLNIARPPQGRPVIAQAGSSGPGRALAARIGEMVFARSLDLDDARAYYADVKQQVAAFGRDPEQAKVLPELATIIAPSRAEAEDKFGALKSLLHPRVALADVEYWLGGIDLSGYPLDGPLPPIQETNASLGTQREIYEQAQRDGLTIGDLATLVADGDRAVVGTPQDVADYIEERFTTAAADGFTVSFPYLPGTLTDFVDLVVPELQRRGLFRTDYVGTTLREHLGLERPAARPR
jgi:FMN-dependent oxidoreductase (nitrilotriacetate monooxygenase family)